MTRVKICGLTQPEDAGLAAELGAWALGFIFYPGSPRFVTGARARELISALPEPAPLKVGVFLDASVEVISRVLEKVPLDLVQVQGKGAAAALSALDASKVIFAAPLQLDSDYAAVRDLPAGWLLADRRRPNGLVEGKLDWELCSRLARERARTLLAGGLTPETVAGAIAKVRPWGVDVASGVESSPGVKDPDKLKAFFSEVRRADAA